MQQLSGELESQRDYAFHTDRLTFSTMNTKGGKPTVTGYISVPEIDLYNDLVTPQAMKSMLAQILSKTITIDYEHEAWRDDNTILPVGRIVEAKVDERGLWVKAELNTHSPKFKALWGSIKDGFITAFSIAFKPLKVVTKTIGDVTVKLIEDLQLLNVALTGSPVNQGAVLTGHSMKSVMLKAIDDTKEEKVLVSKSLITKLMEEKSMGENDEVVEAQVEEVVESPVEAEAKVEVEAEVESTPEPVVEKAKVDEMKKKKLESDDEEDDEEDEDKVEGAKMKAIVADLTKKVEAQAAELKSLKEQPVFKSILSDNKPALRPEKVNMLNLVR